MLPIETVQCPYCGESIDLVIDHAPEGPEDFQQYVEDCHVCCRPINVSVSVDGEGMLSVQAWGENEA